MEIQPSSEVSNTINVTPQKRGRGRPPKYAPEEREQKYRESIDKWREEHKEECKMHRKHFYNENSENLIKGNIEYQTRARNALRLLSEMLDSGELETNKYKHLAHDLIKNKKIIYAG